MCTNRRVVIELNSAIYKKLKEVLELYAALQAAFEKDARTRSRRKVGNAQPLSRRN